MTKPIWEDENTLAGIFWRDGKLPFPVYDMHAHMGAHYANYFKRCEAPEIMKHAQSAGVRRVILSHHEALWGNMRNQQVYDIVHRYPQILRMYVALQPHRQENLREDVKNFEKWRDFAVGFKMLASYHEVAVTDSRYEYALKYADEHALPVLNHTWAGNNYCSAPQMREVIERYPNAKFILGHCIYPDWENAIAIVRDHANAYLDLTGIPGERGVIEKLVAGVGSERIFFGTDLPWFDEFQAIGGVLASGISDTDKRNILCDNARRFLNE